MGHGGHSEWLKIATTVLASTSVFAMLIVHVYNEISQQELQDIQAGFNFTNNTATEEILLRPFNYVGPIVPADQEGCRKIAAIIAKRLLKHIRPCNKELREKYPEAEEFQRHYQCAIRCAFERMNLFTKNFRMTDSSVWAFIETQFPAKYRDVVQRLGYECVVKFKSIVDDSDELCLNHGEFFKCLQNYATDVCQVGEEAEQKPPITSD